MALAAAAVWDSGCQRIKRRNLPKFSQHMLEVIDTAVLLLFSRTEFLAKRCSILSEEAWVGPYSFKKNLREQIRSSVLHYTSIKALNANEFGESASSSLMAFLIILYPGRILITQWHIFSSLRCSSCNDATASIGFVPYRILLYG